MKHFARYANEIDHRNKASMLKYLKLHTVHAESMFRHPTIANCVKLRNLPIPRALEDSAYDYLFGGDPENEPFEWGMILNPMIRDFEKQNACRVSQTGRSGGWLELYQPGYDSVFARFDEYLSEDEPIEKIRDLCYLVEAFDVFCDDVLAEFIYQVELCRDEKQAAKVEAEREHLALLDCPFPMSG